MILYHGKVNLILSAHGSDWIPLRTATTQEFGILGLKLTAPTLRVTSSWFEGDAEECLVHVWTVLVIH